LADTRADIKIPAGTWVNLYTASTITVGTAVSVYNKGSNPCNLVIKATQPSVTTMGMPLGVGYTGNYAAVPANQTGLWCYSDLGSFVLVQE
jgi:hypothetical protein